MHRDADGIENKNILSVASFTLFSILLDRTASFRRFGNALYVHVLLEFWFYISRISRCSGTVAYTKVCSSKLI